ncbi:unnamed protein product [Rhizophagus irregularis]|nr:unnamed protein product [Rhizophagus irregularis]
MVPFSSEYGKFRKNLILYFFFKKPDFGNSSSLFGSLDVGIRQMVLLGFFRGYILTVFRISLLDIGVWVFSQIFGYEISVLPILSGNGGGY